MTELAVVDKQDGKAMCGTADKRARTKARTMGSMAKDTDMARASCGAWWTRMRSSQFKLPVTTKDHGRLVLPQEMTNCLDRLQLVWCRQQSWDWWHAQA